MTGSISRLVNTHGSSWGKIRLTGVPREVFFNATSMEAPNAFWDLQIGDEVVFDEEVDRTNGMRAINMRLTTASPAV